MILPSDVSEKVVVDGASRRSSKPSLVITSASLTRGPHQLVEEQVERTPDAPALTMGREQISYRELNSRSNRLAHFLLEQEVGPESLVGVFLDRSLDSVVSLLAILKAGGTYLPLDPKFPRDRLAFIVADSEVSRLLTKSSRRESLPEAICRVVLLDREADSLSQAAATNLALSGEPESLAYLIYTSGSTGKPKGVMIPRRALVNFLLSMSQTPGLTASDKLLAVTTASFDISILEFLLPLVCGAQIVIATAEQVADARELQRLLRQHGVTVMQATPATWRMLVESGWEGKSDLRIFCGGETLTADLARQLLPRCHELWNLYGPTETTIWSSTERITSADHIFLGTPIANTQFHVLDENHNPVSQGKPGELWISGTGLARGYLKRPELTADRFAIAATSEGPDTRFYRTGDEVRYRADGSLEFLGRLDHQVKLDGFRIELGEIESALNNIEGIAQAVVILREDRPGDKRLVAYYTGCGGLISTVLLQTLKTTLPDYMVPAAFVHLEKFPLTANAKLDRKALPRPESKRPLLAQDFIAPRTAVEKQLANLWCELLQVEEVGIDDSFFDLGGNSLAAARMVSQYHTRVGREIPPAKVFQYPTIAKLAEFLQEQEKENETKSDFLATAENRACDQRHPHRNSQDGNDRTPGAVALIGMTGRFPGADNLDQLWRNLCNSVESISFFTPEELGTGIDEHLRHDPDYIRARGLIEGADLFDAAFFGINPLEARVMDPQQRVFLELAQQALENAGYDPERYKGRIGVFAGIGDNHYYTTNLLSHPDLLAMAGKLAVEYGNQKDYIALRAAYLLDLRGPAISLNTACSTTLLTADQAYRSLLDYECDIALSGGIDITVPQKSGFLYQEGGTFAKDGHCRPFDADASGTMFCDGAGVVVLKRLADAIADGDTIYAMIRGTGKNNNGARPASFLAPSVDGQADAIALAQSNANVPVETIRYIEAHGTGTPVGDPIEFEALRKVFESKTNKKQFCYIGSIKGNIGHPTNAAGVAGLIKAALVLHHEQIPPTLHYRKPNPKIDFASSPFLIADKLTPFPRGAEARRTAVSSFGFGGTNVHVILEEAPALKETSASRPLQLFPLSAKSPAALDAYSRELSEHLADHLAIAAPEAFADAAYTFQTGRKQMSHRRFVVAADASEAAKLLVQPNPLRCSSKRCERRNPPVVFLFGGQGTQYVNMGLNLYRGEPLFRAVLDDCCERLKPHLGRDLRDLLYPQSGDEDTAAASLQDTFFTQPSIFVIEYALASFWQSLGIEPSVMAGHSIGEFVAATLAGVWQLEDALSIIALRGRFMQNLARGSMMAVSSSADSIAKILPAALQIASNNAPALCVVSGPEADVADFQKQLEASNLEAESLGAEKIVCRHLHTSHAFHSAMMDPMVEPLREAIAKIHLHPPARPFVSTVTGRLITAAETTDPAYWANHARATVEFSKAIQYLKDQGHDLFLECGPRSSLCSLVRQQFTPDHPCTAIPTFADTPENNAEWATLLFALGSLWQNGVSIDWDAFYAHEDRRRIPLPTYPFERQRFWVDPAPVATVVQSLQAAKSAAVTRSAVEAFVEPANPAPPLVSAAPGELLASRKDRIASRVIDLLMPVSGRERSQIITSATFMEQGFDSLSLTQVAFAIGQDFSVKVSFSQLMNQWPNIDMLAAHFDATLPADILAETPASALSVSISPLCGEPTCTEIQANSLRAVPMTGNTLEEVIAEQARTIASLVGLLEKAGMNHPVATASDHAGMPLVTLLPQDNPPGNAVAASNPLEVESTIPQRGIFASSCLSERLSASYNESMTLRFAGKISIEKMTRSIDHLVERHDALRGSFDETGRIMKIIPAQKIATSVTDLSTISDPTLQEERLRKLISDETALPFPLPAGPLFRSQMILLGPDRAAVIFTAHHIICDGWSLDVLIHDLCAFYSEEISGAPSPLQPRKSYFDYVKKLSERQHSDEFKEAGKYWHAKFNSRFPVLVLPTDHPRSARREFSARRLDHPIPAALVEKLRAVGTKQGCSFFAVLLSALAVLLARISQQRCFVIALPTAEQPEIGQPALVGHCVNLLPFAVELRDSEAFSAFLKRVQGELVAAQDHAIFTMVSLLESLHPIAPGPGISPISTGLTSVNKFKPAELPQTGFTVDYDANPKSYESFELYLNAVEVEDRLELRCHYDIKLFEDLTIREWLATLGSIFQDLAADPAREVLDLAGLKCAEASPATEIVYTQTSNREVPHEFVADVPSSAHRLQRQRSDSPVNSTIAEPPLLRALLPLWQRVLDIHEIGPDDDFFALGGHSIAAAQLFVLIKSHLGCTAPLSILYDASTPRMLASILTRASKNEDLQSPVVINRPGRSGDRPPLFPVHAAEDNVLLYRSLAAHLGAEQPALGLHSAGLDGSSPTNGPFEHAARTYIDESRHPRSHGACMPGASQNAKTVVHEPIVELVGTPTALPQVIASPPLGIARTDFAVRPFVEEDILQVADLWWTFLRRRKGPAPGSVRAYFHELYFKNNPWSDSAFPSLVYEGKSGRIAGFLGVIRREMSVRGQSIRVAFGGNLVVHPEARSSPACSHLLGAYMAGDQELSMTDSANDASRLLLESLGFHTIEPLSISWARPLRPAHYAVHALSSLTGPLLSASLKFASRPFCSIVDSMSERLSFGPFRQTQSSLHPAELDVETLLQCLIEFRRGYSLWPEYDAHSLKWLLTFMERMHAGAILRKVVLRNDRQKILGWYVYYLKPDAVGQVVQLGGERQFTKDILDHLLYDAWAHGAIAVHGALQSHLMPDFWEKKCFFTCRGGWTLAHSRQPEILELLNRGDAFLSRLDGEWCLGFDA
jgi:amino acid adenylation domain-containing protein